MMTRDELLGAAADILRQRGMTKNVLVEGDPHTGPVCLVGALNVAWWGTPTPGKPWPHAYREATRALGACAAESDVETFSDGIIAAVDYNNAEGVTLDDVLALIECATNKREVAA